MSRGIKRFLIALQFLTILPVKIRPGIKEEDFGRSLAYFPLVGLIIGLVLSGITFLNFLPNLAKSAFILSVSIIITGGIHLDGFVDTCDGFYGSKPKEKILEIMRDSHIGAMGAIALSSLLILKFSLIAGLPDNALWKAMILMAVFSRWAQVLACGVSSYARRAGKAKYFIERACKREIFTGAIFTSGLFLLLMRLEGLILFFLSTVCVYLFLRYIKKRINGMTGDTIGAASEIAETLILLFSCIMSSIWNL